MLYTVSGTYSNTKLRYTSYGCRNDGKDANPQQTKPATYFIAIGVEAVLHFNNVRVSQLPHDL